MRDESDTATNAARKQSPRLVVVRAPAGAGKSKMVRGWTDGFADTVLVWPDVTSAPNGAVSFWMRVITLLHSQGFISDEHLFHATVDTSQNGDVRHNTLGRLFGRIGAPPTLIIDDLQRVLAADEYARVIDDISYLLAGCTRLHVVVIEHDLSPLDDMDIAGRITIGAEHVPPVALLGDFFSLPTSPTANAMPLRLLLRDRLELKAVCLAALPPTVEPELAEALTGRDGSAMLDAAELLALGAWQDDPAGGARFEFHSSVRVDAQAELRRSWPLDKIAAARHLARWYIARADDTLAFEFAVIAEDIALISHLWLRLMPFAGPLPGDSEDRIARLPLDKIRESAVLSLWMARRSETSAHPTVSTKELYAAAVKAAQVTEVDLRVTEKLILTGIESFAALRAGDARHAVYVAKQFRERAMRLLSAQRIDDALVQPFVELAYEAGVTLTFGEDHGAAADLFAELAKLCLLHGLEYRRSSALAALGYHYAMAGLLPEATAMTRAAAAYTGRGSEKDSSYTAFLQIAELTLAAHEADFVRLRRAISSLGEGRALTEHWDVLLFGEMLLDLAAGNVVAARVRFDSAVRLHMRTDVPAAVRRRLTYLRTMLMLVDETSRVLSVTLLRAPADPLSLSLSATRAIDERDLGQAEAMIDKAIARASTPIEQHFSYVVLARLGAARADLAIVSDAAAHLLSLLRVHNLRIGFALLTEYERSTVLASTSGASELRAAFAHLAAMPPRPSAMHKPVLTPRQLAVIRALDELGDRRAVARKLFLSPGTVKAHLRTIYKKLDAHSQVEVLCRAAALGLLEPRDDRRCA